MLTETDIIPTVKAQLRLFSSVCTFLRLQPFDDRNHFYYLIGLTKACPAGKKRLDVLAKALIFSPGVYRKPGENETGTKELAVEEEGVQNRHRKRDYDPLSVTNHSWYMDAEQTLKMFKDSSPDMAAVGDGKESKDAPLEMGQLSAIQKLTVKWMQKRESSFPGGGILIDNGKKKVALNQNLFIFLLS